MSEELRPCPFCGLHKCKRCNYHIAGYEDKDVINQWNTRSAIRKEFCPNCEKETECEFTAELYECKECGEDFAKYIVSRSIENNNPDYYKDDYRAAATYPARSRKITHRSKGRGN